MFDAVMLGAVRRGSERALGKFIDRYGAYVCTVIRSAANGLAREDVEEVASDVFFALWENADRVKKVKPWLAAVARNKARNKLREIRGDLPVDEMKIAAGGDLEKDFILDCEAYAVREAVLSLSLPDRDIFLKHYFEAETAAAIASEIGLTEAAVKHRLVRGRKKLKKILECEVSA